mmetsp:Transcript_23812/g.70346  ORF Transcript_23812/g.70346 Transcript_23812/m.70346 type:complete len:522 (-) Transcript_23812:2-1567(-)
MRKISSTSGFLALAVLNRASNADGAKVANHLYLGDNDTAPVIDFDKADPFEYPTFLNSTNNGPRVVEFYAPWCSHCQHFKPTYVKLARDVTSTNAGADVRFYAVSCTAHGRICNDQGVKGYPCIKLFKAGEANGEKAENRKKIGVESVLSQLGLRSEHEGSDEVGQGRESIGESPKKEGKSELVIQKAALTEEEIAASTHKRTKANVFNDASLSLDFTFRHGIFMSKGPLSLKKKDALRKWINLLKYALPVDMKYSHEQLAALTLKFDDVVQSEDALKNTIAQIQFERDDWSLACTHGHPHKGYTCGLWELFHIVAVGVVETNEWQSSSNKISTLYAAGVVRNFIEEFFGCEECRKNFLKMYDQCFFGRCDRLSTDASLRTERTRELPLWLSEVHNAVNVRLLHERKLRENKPVPTAEDVKSVEWPNRAECPHCWKDDGMWDTSEVYMYLKSEYGTSRFKPTRLRQRVKHLITHEGEFVDSSVALLSHSSVLPLAALLVMLTFWMLREKQRNNFIRRSKKR